MKTRPQPGRAPETLRRTATRSFSLATKTAALPRRRGALRSLWRADWGRTDWRRAIYHHPRLVSDPNVSDKEARAAAEQSQSIGAVRLRTKVQEMPLARLIRVKRF
jgi:hypothetical protein